MPVSETLAEASQVSGREVTVVDRPRVFGDYLLLTTLARGGMGAIHLARRLGFQPDLAPYCVVKMLRARFRSAPAMLERFADEARVAVTLRHRAICNVFEVGVVEDQPYLAMELIEGVSVGAVFRTLRRAKRRLVPSLALYLIDEALDALAYAGAQIDPATGAALRLVHRDVSPQNLMLSYRGAVKLIDFGLVSTPLRHARTECGVVVGKAAYMSPEQARGEPADERSDVFSAAVVLHELLSGRRFHPKGSSKEQILRALASESVKPDIAEIPPPLVGPLGRALAMDVAERTPSAAQFQADLAAAGLKRATARDAAAMLRQAMPAAEAELAETLQYFRDVVAAAPCGRAAERMSFGSGAEDPIAGASLSEGTLALSITRSLPPEPSGAPAPRWPSATPTA